MMSPSDQATDESASAHVDSLRERLTIATTVVLVSNGIFAIADLFLSPAQDLIGIFACKVFQIIVALWVRWQLPKSESFSYLQLLGIALASSVLAMTASSGVISQDSLTTPILTVAVLLGIAGILPWQPWAQSILALIAINTAGLQQWILAHPLHYGMVGVVSAGLCSIIVVHLLEKGREETEAEAKKAHAGRAEEVAVSSAIVDGSRKIIEALDADELLPSIAKIMCESLESDVAVVLTPSSERDGLVAIAQSGMSAELWQEHEGVPVQGSLARFVAADLPGQSVSAHALVQRGDQFHIAKPGDRAVPVLMIRLAQDSRPAGYLTAWRDLDSSFFSERELRIARGLSPIIDATLRHRGVLEQLERSHRWQYNFLASMSHELRTPLNVILGYSEMLLDPEQTSARETEIDLYRRIHENARTQLQLVNEALEMSRNDDEGTLTMRDEEIVPDTIVGELIQEGTLRNPDGQTRLVANVATDFGRFRGDPVKLRMILTNLLDNSIKFTKKGVIEVGARRDRDMISFWVRDTGIGIPEELRPELFRAFRKGNQSDQSGLGIGLYIVKRLVESFDGEIQLSSEPGEGSTFTVFFPDQGESTVHS